MHGCKNTKLILAKREHALPAHVAHFWMLSNAAAIYDHYKLHL